MKWMKFCSVAFVATMLCTGMTSCSDDADYFESDIQLPMLLGGVRTFTDLWHCNQPDAWVAEGQNGMKVLNVPAEGGKYVLTINPESTYYIVGSDNSISGPYDNIPQTLYPIPDSVYEMNVENPVYYTCSPAASGVWQLVYNGPLESPYGKFYMEKNKLTIDLKKCGKDGRVLSLRVGLCEDLQYPMTIYSATSIIIRQGK